MKALSAYSIRAMLSLAALCLPILATAAAADVSGIALCRTLREAARVECLGKYAAGRARVKYGSSSARSSSSSSAISDRFHYPETYQDQIGQDKTFVPEGASCVRFTDARRAACRVRQLQAGTGRSASSSSSIAVSQRRHCNRLPTAEKLACLREARQAIDVITRTVK